MMLVDLLFALSSATCASESTDMHFYQPHGQQSSVQVDLILAQQMPKLIEVIPRLLVTSGHKHQIDQTILP